MQQSHLWRVPPLIPLSYGGGRISTYTFAEGTQTRSLRRPPSSQALLICIWQRMGPTQWQQSVWLWNPTPVKWLYPKFSLSVLSLPQPSHCIFPHLQTREPRFGELRYCTQNYKSLGWQDGSVADVFAARLTTWIGSLGPTWWKERTDPHKLSSDLHSPVHIYTYTKNK